MIGMTSFMERIEITELMWSQPIFLYITNYEEVPPIIYWSLRYYDENNEQGIGSSGENLLTVEGNSQATIRINTLATEFGSYPTSGIWDYYLEISG